MQFLYFTVHRHLGKLSSTASMVLLLILSSLVVVIKVISGGSPAALTQLQPPSRLLLLREGEEKDQSFLSQRTRKSSSPILNFIQLFFQQPLDLRNKKKWLPWGVLFMLAANVTDRHYLSQKMMPWICEGELEHETLSVWLLKSLPTQGCLSQYQKFLFNQLQNSLKSLFYLRNISTHIFVK